MLKIEKQINARITLLSPTLNMQHLKAAVHRDVPPFQKWQGVSDAPQIVQNIPCWMALHCFEKWCLDLLSHHLKWALGIHCDGKKKKVLVRWTLICWNRISSGHNHLGDGHTEKCQSKNKELGKEKVLWNVLMKYKLSVLTTLSLCFVFYITLFVHM